MKLFIKSKLHQLNEMLFLKVLFIVFMFTTYSNPLELHKVGSSNFKSEGVQSFGYQNFDKIADLYESVETSNVTNFESYFGKFKQFTKHFVENSFNEFVEQNEIDENDVRHLENLMKNLINQGNTSENKGRRRQKRYFTSEGLRPLQRTPELIREQNYPCEVHRVQTPDGYILELHRIPGLQGSGEQDGRFGRRKRSTSNSKSRKNFQTKNKKSTSQKPFTSVENGTPPLKLKNKGVNSIHETAYDNSVQHGLNNKDTKYLPSYHNSESNGRGGRRNASNEYPAALLYKSRNRRSLSVIMSLLGHETPFIDTALPKYGLKQLRTYGTPKPVVLLHHGLFASSAAFVLSDAHQAIAYLLADLGYDVWMANWRGNPYSNRHVTLSSADYKFWDFSLDDIMKYDVPTVFDYILNTTKQESLFYVGHSLGCAVFYGATNYRPNLSQKVRLMVSLAPASFMDDGKGPLVKIATLTKIYYKFLDTLQIPDAAIPAPVKNFITEAFCGSTTLSRLPCYFMMTAFMGSIRRSPFEYYTNILLTHLPGGIAASRLLAHFGQFIKADGMHLYDFGMKRNLVKYGQPTPPEYSLSKVTCPVAVFWGPGDRVTTPKDVEKSVQSLPNVIFRRRIPDPKFSHIDFMLPEQAFESVYLPIVKMFKRIVG